MIRTSILMFGRKQGKHRLTDDEAKALLLDELPEGMRGKVVERGEISSLPDYPPGASATDFEWCVGFNKEASEWALMVHGYQVDGHPPMITRVPSRELGLYLVQLQHFMLREVREWHAEQEEAKEAGQPDDTGEGSRIEPLPMVHGEHSLQAPWPRGSTGPSPYL